MKLIVLAVLFVFTSGSLFSERFRKHKSLSILAGLVALTSAVLMFQAIRVDVKQIKNIPQTVNDSDELLSDLPSPAPSLISNFGYRIESSNTGIRVVFPKEAIDNLFLISGNGDLAGAMFSAKANNGTEIVCQHFMPYSSTNPDDLGLYDMSKLIPKLDCAIWVRTSDGHSGRGLGEASLNYDRILPQLSIDASGPEVLELLNLTTPVELVFRSGFPTLHRVVEQKVMLR